MITDRQIFIFIGDVTEFRRVFLLEVQEQLLLMCSGKKLKSAHNIYTYK